MVLFAGLIHLRHLYAKITTDADANQYDSDELETYGQPREMCRTARELCCLPQLTTLQSISQPELYRRGSPRWSNFPDGWGLWPWPDAVVGRLTRLDLSDNRVAVGQVPEHVMQLMDLLSRATALQFLNISGNMLRDDAMLQFAPVLSQLTGLSWLSIRFNDASHEGIFPVLQTLVDLRTGGEMRLQVLDVSWNCISDEKMGDLESLVAQLEGVRVSHWQNNRPTLEQCACSLSVLAWSLCVVYILSAYTGLHAFICVEASPLLPCQMSTAHCVCMAFPTSV